MKAAEVMGFHEFSFIHSINVVIVESRDFLANYSGKYYKENII